MTEQPQAESPTPADNGKVIGAYASIFFGITIVTLAFVLTETDLLGTEFKHKRPRPGQSSRTESHQPAPAAPELNVGLKERLNEMRIAREASARESQASQPAGVSKSATVAYYDRWMRAQVVCLGNVETILALPHEKSEAACVGSAIEVVRRHYHSLLKLKDGLSTAGVDPAVVAYVNQQADLCARSMQALPATLDQWNAMNSQLASISSTRARNEVRSLDTLRATYGDGLGRESEYRSKMQAAETRASESFRANVQPSGLVAPLIGLSFYNTKPGAAIWHVEEGEFVSGRITASSASWNTVSFQLQMDFRGSRSGNPGGVFVALVVAKDPQGGQYIPVFAANLSTK